MNEQIKVGLYLMNEKGYEVLRHFVNLDAMYMIAYVVSAQDNSMKKDYFDEIRGMAIENKIDFFHRAEKFQRECAYKLAIGWRWLIQPYDNLIVLHDSLLPKYRGFAPLVNMLLHKEEEIGVTALFASKNYDEGDIIFQSSTRVTYPITILAAIDTIKSCYIACIDQLIACWQRGERLPRKAQEGEQATYSLWRDEEDYHINWSETSENIRRFIDAVGFPFKGAFALVDDEIIRIFKAEEVEDKEIVNRDYGKVICFEQDKPVVVCGKGLLKILEMKDETGKDHHLKKFRTRFK